MNRTRINTDKTDSRRLFLEFLEVPLLLKAKKRRLIGNIKPLINSIVEGGYWIKEDIIEGILKEAGE